MPKDHLGNEIVIPEGFKQLAEGSPVKPGDAMWDGTMFRKLSLFTIVGCNKVLEGEIVIRAIEDTQYTGNFADMGSPMCAHDVETAVACRLAELTRYYFNESQSKGQFPAQLICSMTADLLSGKCIVSHLHVTALPGGKATIGGMECEVESASVATIRHVSTKRMPAQLFKATI